MIPLTNLKTPTTYAGIIDDVEYCWWLTRNTWRLLASDSLSGVEVVEDVQLDEVLALAHLLPQECWPAPAQLPTNDDDPIIAYGGKLYSPDAYDITADLVLPLAAASLQDTPYIPTALTGYHWYECDVLKLFHVEDGFIDPDESFDFDEATRLVAWIPEQYWPDQLEELDDYNFVKRDGRLFSIWDDDGVGLVDVRVSDFLPVLAHFR